MKDLVWKFRGVGTYAGVTSFGEGDDERHYLRVDYWGGKVSAELSAEVARSIESKRDAGCDVRVSGDVQVGQGVPRLILKGMRFEGDEGWSEPSDEERFSGVVFEGLCEVMDKKSSTSDNGVIYFNVSVKANGGILRRLPVASQEVFDSFSLGMGRISGSVYTDISTVYKDFRRQAVVRNDMQVTGFAPLLPSSRRKS